MTDKKPQPPKKRVEVTKVEDPIEEVEVEVEVEPKEVEVETPVVAIDPAPVTVTPFIAPPAPPTTYAVVGAGDRDDVSLSKVVYKNTFAKKSLSVHHIQRRLKERGYDGAFLDKDGYYGDHTLAAMKQFQADQGIVGGTGIADLETLTKLFEGDSNVRVTP